MTARDSLADGLRTVRGVWRVLAWGIAIASALLLGYARLNAQIDDALAPIEARVTVAEGRNFANEQWDRDAAAVLAVQMAGQVRFEAALYEPDPRLRAGRGRTAELAFRGDATALLGGYWALSANDRRNYDLAGKLSIAQQRALGTAGAAPP